MGKPWGRLYGGTRNHRKIKLLSQRLPNLWVYWYVLIDMAIEVDDGGWIYVAPGVPYTMQELAKELRLYRESQVISLASTLQSLGMITVSDKGLLLNSFAERNYESDYSTPRVRKYREKQKQHETMKRPETVFETVTETDQNRTDTEQIQNRDKDTPLPPVPALPSPKKKPKTFLPIDFQISERVRSWAVKKGFGQLEAHLEAFKLLAQAKGYEYADWDSAFMNAIRGDWGKVREQVGLSKAEAAQERRRATVRAFVEEGEE